MSLTKPDGVWHGKILFDEASLILNPLPWDMGKSFGQGLRNPVLLGDLIYIDLFNLKGQHHSSKYAKGMGHRVP